MKITKEFREELTDLLDQYCGSHPEECECGHCGENPWETIELLRAELQSIRSDPCFSCIRKPIRPTHGPCCMCSICGKYYDDCGLPTCHCSLYEAEIEIERLRSELAAVRRIDGEEK